jgi:hypothetical protein
MALCRRLHLAIAGTIKPIAELWQWISIEMTVKGYKKWSISYEKDGRDDENETENVGSEHEAVRQDWKL